MAVVRWVQKYLRFLSVGSFLGVRQIRRGNIWINLLIISIMTLTFLSLVVIQILISISTVEIDLVSDMNLYTLGNQNCAILLNKNLNSFKVRILL